MLARLFQRHAEERAAPFVVSGPWGWGWAGMGSGGYEALKNSAVWACVDVLCSAVADLPIGAVRESGSARLPVSPTPSLIARPSALVDQDVWIYQVMWSMLSDGNGWGTVTSVDSRQRPLTIETLHPDQVTERQVKAGVIQAKVDNEVMRAFPHGDLWHVPGRMIPPGSPFGLSPVEYAKKAIDSALSAEDFGYRFFTDGGHPSAIIYADTQLSPEQGRQVKESYLQATRGTREPAVFGSGLKHEQVSVNPDDSQFLDLQRFAVEQACRFFRVPPSMVYAAVSGQAVTYANVSQADLDFLKHSLERYLVRFERALTALIPSPQMARMNRNALLRSDPAGRYAVHKIALETKTRTVNEVRALEDEEPFDDPMYDEPGIPGAPAPAAPTMPAEEPDGGT